MKVTSTGVKNGIISEEYGGRGNQFNENGVPNYSLPFQVEGAPEGTVSLALVLEDKDACPVTGFFYSGMTPPDKDHVYELHIFALDCMLELENGFWLNELYQKMEGHILATDVCKGVYYKM